MAEIIAPRRKPPNAGRDVLAERGARHRRLPIASTALRRSNRHSRDKRAVSSKLFAADDKRSKMHLPAVSNLAFSPRDGQITRRRAEWCRIVPP